MMGKKDSWLEEFLSKNVVGVLVGVLLVAVAAGVVITRAYFIKYGEVPGDPASWGQLGDYLGGVLNPVFGFLSVFALLVALVLQTRELKLSRESLKATLKEQAESSKALALQNKAIQRQSFEQTFFAWLGTYREVLREISGEEGAHGRAALKQIWLDWMTDYRWKSVSAVKRQKRPIMEVIANLMLGGLEGVSSSEQCQDVSRAAAAAWEKLYCLHEIQLDSVFRVLYRLLKWIDDQPVELLGDADKWLYTGIVRSQLSWIEMVFLFYNGMTQRGRKFKWLAERYAMFDNLTIESDVLLAIVKDFPMDGEGYCSSAFSSDMARAMEGRSD